MIKKLILGFLFIVLVVYSAAALYYYVNQEKMIFAPIPLAETHEFQFEIPFEEISINTNDKKKLNALHFKTENPKAVLYYLHGKSGNLKTWGKLAQTYVELGYDVLMLDYRGFGKSEGKINSEEEFYKDSQLGYDYLKRNFREEEITILGFSLGSGAAAKLAVDNHPKELLLLAPYFQVDEKFKKDKFYLPKFLCKYEFPVDEFLPKIIVPIRIFYGDKDVIIDQKEVKALKSGLKTDDKLIELKNQGHNGIEVNEEFLNYFRNNFMLENFNKFSVPVSVEKYAELDFSENEFKSDPTFIQFIRNEIQNEPINFAGKYTILEKSCGVECSHIILIDRISGRVFDEISINNESCGFLYQANSKLLIRNSNSLTNGNKNYYEEIDYLPIYYIWNGNDFDEI